MVLLLYDCDDDDCGGDKEKAEFQRVKNKVRERLDGTICKEKIFKCRLAPLH